MSTSEKNLGELFQEWNEFNKKVGESFSNFDFETIKKIRKKQREIEDKVYSHLFQKASNELKGFLPEDCGSFEIGFNLSEKKFYFLMADPEQDDDETPIKIWALTIDINKNIDVIKDFQED
ncbi:MAG: hypothetical protein ACTSQG_05045 [Promethearchaeota archaeon]